MSYYTSKSSLTVRRVSGSFFLLCAFFCLFSCTTTRTNVVYMNNLGDSIDRNISSSKVLFESAIQINDLLSIKISSLNPADVSLINGGGSGASAASGPSAGANTGGYLVNSQGKVELPLIGFVNAKGLNRAQLEDSISSRMKEYIKDPVVQIRFLNFHITVLGDVGRPGELVPPTERFTILEALGESGDLKVTGRRDNVLIIREKNGKRQVGRIDLTSKSLFNSPYFYLQANDVIYVEPVKASYAHRNDSYTQYIGVASGIISLLVSIILLTRTR